MGSANSRSGVAREAIRLVGDGGERFGESVLEDGEGTGLERAQLLFDLCPALFERVKVRRVEKQVTERGAGLFNRFPDTVHFMGSGLSITTSRPGFNCGHSTCSG